MGALASSPLPKPALVTGLAMPEERIAGSARPWPTGTPLTREDAPNARPPVPSPGAETVLLLLPPVQGALLPGLHRRRGVGRDGARLPHRRAALHRPAA